MAAMEQCVNPETVKRRLKRYALLGEEVIWLRDELRRCRRQQLELIQSLRTQGVGAGRKAIEVMCEGHRRRGSDLINRIRNLQGEQMLIDRLMESLETQERCVLRMRLLEGRSWVYISMHVFLCERQCQRVQKRALQKIAQVLSGVAA